MMHIRYLAKLASKSRSFQLWGFESRRFDFGLAASPVLSRGQGLHYSFCPALTEHHTESCGSGVPWWFWNKNRTGIAPGDSVKHPEGTQGPLPASGTKKKKNHSHLLTMCAQSCAVPCILKFCWNLTVILCNCPTHGDFDISVKYTC